MTINIEKPEALYIQIAKDIKNRISCGKFNVGDKLASQKELADEYSVSLITIKKALADLSKEGVIYGRPGKGTFVSNNKQQVSFSKLSTIGFVLRDMDSPFFSKILSSVEKKLSGEAYNLLLSSTAGLAENEENMIRHFIDIGVNGLIIASMARDYCATATIRNLHKDNFPYVVVSYISDEDIYSVGIDHEDGAFKATQHLIALGYKTIGYINADEGNVLGNERKRGYLRALQQYNLEYNPEFECQLRLLGEWNDYQSGYEIGTCFVKAPTRPEAIFAFDDLAALGFQRAILDNGLKVPQDVAIVGFDDIRRGVTAPVPLTTIHQPTAEIGEVAVDVLLRRIRGYSVRPKHILNTSLIVRNSCGARLGQIDKDKKEKPTAYNFQLR